MQPSQTTTTAPQHGPLNPVIDPSTGVPFASCPFATPEQVDSAVRQAAAAFAGWRSLSWSDRAAAMRTLAAAVRSHDDELVGLLTREQGKPLAAARSEILRAAEIFEQVAGFDEIEPELLEVNAEARVEQQFVPRGPAVVITPWNVPIGIAALRAAPFLLTGNTVLVKPSPYTPLTSARLGELAADVLPAGVLTVINGDNEVGAQLTAHPAITAVSVTGSQRTGRTVMATAGPAFVHVGLELGGNDPALVLDDADPRAVARRIAQLAFANSGQICMAIKRVYAHESIYDELVDELARAADALHVGPGHDPASDLGPVQNHVQYEALNKLMDETRAIPGVRIATAPRSLPEAGYFVAPTIVADISDGTRLVDDEQFGPLLPVVRVRDDEDAVTRANASSFGLSASVWSPGDSRAHDVASRLEAGTVWINTHFATDVGVPFGGWKSSGVGRVNGRRGLHDCMESRVVWLASEPAASRGERS